jgi:hypothetical protein
VRIYANGGEAGVCTLNLGMRAAVMIAGDTGDARRLSGGSRKHEKGA